MINIYLHDARGLFAGTMKVDPYGAMPGNSTLDAPPAMTGTQVAVYDNGNWTIYASAEDVPKPPVPVPAPIPVPEEISPRQFRQTLNKFGFRSKVEAAIAASNDQDLKDWYEFTSVFQRHHPEVIAMASALGFTSDQLDQVWIYGASLT